ncbi:MAG: hypothetical protein O3B86_03440, partial [Planctomycetota bacterium]|nr:hypothetical protein [Planctomycetota bacterium]
EIFHGGRRSAEVGSVGCHSSPIIGAQPAAATDRIRMDEFNGEGRFYRGGKAFEGLYKYPEPPRPTTPHPFSSCHSRVGWKPAS